MNSFKIITYLILLSFGLIACNNNGAKDIRNYYFPLKSLEGGLVYEYRPPQQDSLTPIYWYYRTLPQEEEVYLTGTYYEYDFTPMQLIRERLVNNGMVLEDIYLYETDSTGRQNQVPVEVLADNAFPFMVRDSGGIFLYKVSWTAPSNPNATITLIKNRRYVGDTTYIYKEEVYDAVLFDVKELFEHDDKEEGYIEQQYNGTEIYAEGIGLVYYRKNISKGFKLEYALYDRYPMEQLEEKFKRYKENEIDIPTD